MSFAANFGLTVVSRSHGIADACEMTRLVMTIRVEVMLEEINALIYRGQGIQAETVSED